MTIRISGSSSATAGMNSRSSLAPKANSVGGNRSPRPKGSPISPTGSSKFPPELCGAPAAGSGSCPASSAAKFAGGMLIVPIMICGIRSAPSTITSTSPFGSVTTKSAPTARMASSRVPAGSWILPSTGTMRVASGGIVVAGPAPAAKALPDGLDILCAASAPTPPYECSLLPSL